MKEQGRLSTVVEAQERALIINALKETNGNQTKAAKLLGTTKRIIQYRIMKLGIDARQFRGKKTDPTKGRR
jgi:Nif-specific regulatory protein